MINYVDDIFQPRVQAFVNTVNLVGVMGKGIALECKKRWPRHYLTYKLACSKGEIKIGKVLVVSNSNPEYIICFPTKVHWRNPSQYEWIESGLVDLRRVIDELGIKSVAIPKLGCNNGGLEWEIVKEMIIKTFDGSCVDVYLQIASKESPSF